MKPYPRYKPTGLAWLPSVPEHWEVRKLRHILSPVSEKNHAEKPLLSVVREKGVILRDTENKEENHNFIPDDLSNYKLVREDQFAMNKMKAWQGSYGVSSYEGIVSPAYFVFDVHGVEKDFFHTAIRSAKYVAYFAQSSDGIRVGQWDLSIPRMKEIPFLIPPPSEQDRIVRYLDEKTAAIDELVRAKERQIELLRERKQALVSAAVTGGLDPATERKDSGVPWIGKIPKGWSVVKFKRIAKVCANLVEPNQYADYPQIAPECIEKGSGRLVMSRTVRDAGVESGNHLFKAGQILYSKIRPTLNKVVIAPCDGLCSADMYPIETTQNKRWFLFFMLSSPFVQQVTECCARVKMPKINKEDLGQLLVAVPPLPEQERIVAHLDSVCSELDAAEAAIRKQIALLQELRTRLVSDAVTGAVEV